MASRELRFDVSALDQASRVFVKMASAVDRFERRLDKLDGKTVDATVDVDTRRAEDKLGRFTTDLRRRVQNAIDAIPPIDLDANSTEADRKLADVRRRMQELRDVRIGVDLSADEAIRRSRELQRELAEISRSDPRVDVRANTDAAARDLAEINREVDRLDGREAVVTVRTDRSLLDSTRHITRLGAALRAIAIPSAILVGTPALVSLGGAAATAAGSLLLLPAAGNAAGLAVGTLITAFQGFGDAIGDDPEKAAQALAKLTPAARSAATEVNKLDPAFRRLRESVQETFFSGLGERIGELGGRWMPMLEGATTRVAGQFNVAADGVLQFLGHSKTVATFRDGFLDLGTAIGNLTPTIVPFTSILTDIGTVGATVLADITGGAEDAATGLADMVSRARESGQMEAAIRGGLNELRRFGQLAGNTGGILKAMYDAGKASGNDFLGTLIDVTGRMDDFLSSAQGQAAMVQIFTGMNSAVTALLPGLEAVGSAIGQIATDRATSGALTSMAGAFSDLLVAAAPTAVAISRVVTMGLQPFGEVLGFVAPFLGPVVGGLLALKAASSALNFLTAAAGLKTLGSAMATTAAQIPAVARHLPQVATSAAAAGTAAAGAATGVVAVGTASGNAAGNTSKVASALGKVQTVASKVATALPLVGLAFIGIDAGVRAMTVSLSDAMTAYNQGGTAAEEMRRKVEEQTLAFGPNQNAFERAGNTALDWVRSNLFGVATVDDFNASIEEQNRLMAESVAATGISRSAYDEITGSMDRSKKAAQEVTDALAIVGPALAGVKDGVAPTREMDEALKGMARTAGESAQAAGESAARYGGVAAGAKAAADSMQATREAFISSATAAGMTEAAAGKLADQLGLIPETARTNFETNAATTAMEISQVRDKLAEVPLGKAVTVTAMTDTAKSALTTLGLQVETMKDGTVRVTADTQEAQNNLNSFIAGSQDKKTTITIDGQAQPAQSALNSILGAIRAGRETVTIDGQTQPVLQALSYVLGTVGGAQGDVTIGAQTMPADAALGHYLAAVNSADGTVKVGAETFTADQILAAFISRAQSPVTKPLLADPSDVYAKEAEVDRVVGTPSTMPIHGDANPLVGALPGLRAQVGASPGLMPIQVGENGLPNAILTNLGIAAGSPAQQPVTPGTNGVPPVLAQNQGLAGGALANQPIGPGANGVPGAILGNQGLAAGSTATQPLDANPAPANAKIHGVVGLAGQSTGTLTIDGNPTMANGKVTTAVRFADGSRGTITVDANEQPANGRIRATVTYADRSTGTVTVNANDAAARNAISNLQRPTYSTHTVRIATVGRIADVNVALARANRAEGAYTIPGYAGGGYRRLRPMSATRAEVIPARSWRVIGDRQSGDELFLPLQRAVQRNHDLLAMGARKMGYDLVPAGTIAQAAASGVQSELSRVPDLAGVRARIQAAQVSRVATPAPQITVRAGADVAQLKALLVEFRSLRGDLTRGQGWGAVVDRLNALIDIEAKARSSATGRSALARDIGEIGGW